MTNKALEMLHEESYKANVQIDKNRIEIKRLSDNNIGLAIKVTDIGTTLVKLRGLDNE